MSLARIVLTWGILLYHVTLIYTPYLSYYVRVIPEQVPSWHLASLWFVISMNAWNMPMFFFLSGIRLAQGELEGGRNRFADRFLVHAYILL